MGDEFNLEPSPPPGEIPDAVISELRECRRRAHDFAQAFSDAVKAQALKYQIVPAALRKYVQALESDSLEKAEKEASALQELINK